MSAEVSHRPRFHTMRIVIVAVGGGLIALALTADAIGLSQASGFGAGQALLTLGGLGALLVALILRPEDLRSARSLAGRLAWLYRTAGLLLLNVLVILALIELASILLIRLDLLPKGLEPVQSSYYAAQEWGGRYWSEFFAASKTSYQPYIVWRKVPFAGEAITIDEDGRRVTPGADCREGAYTVYTFGGSTMWGMGSPDWGTIPAYLQTGLDTLRSEPVCVVNFGEPAWVSTQSLIALMLQLQAGNTPDLVIFYDGVNEIYAAAQSGRPVVHHNLSQIAAYVEGGWGTNIRRLLESTSTFQALQRFGLVTGLDSYRIMDVDTASLAEAVIQTYARNYELVDTLAERYGFDYAFFWQPAIVVGNKPFTQEEETLKAALGQGVLVDLFAEVYQHVGQATRQYERLYDITDVFDGQETLIYVDPLSHVTPEGNALIAQRMLDAIGDQLGWE